MRRALVYEEGSLIKTRDPRTSITKDTAEILVDGEAGYRDAKGLHAHAHAEPCEEREALQRTPAPISAGIRLRLNWTRCSAPW